MCSYHSLNLVPFAECVNQGILTIPTRITFVHKKLDSILSVQKCFECTTSMFHIYQYKNILCAQQVCFIFICIKIFGVHNK